MYVFYLHTIIVVDTDFVIFRSTSFLTRFLLNEKNSREKVR